RVPHDFLRHATDVYARPAETRRLEQHDLRAMLGRALRHREAAAAAAEYDQIECFHQVVLSRRAENAVPTKGRSRRWIRYASLAVRARPGGPERAASTRPVPAEIGKSSPPWRRLSARIFATLP